MNLLAVGVGTIAAFVASSTYYSVGGLVLLKELQRVGADEFEQPEQWRESPAVRR